MMSFRTIRGFWRGAAAAAAVVTLAACQDRYENTGLLEPEEVGFSELTVSLVTSDLTANVGDRIAVAVRLDGIEPEDVGALQGYLRFDPSELEFAGQVVESPTMLVINDGKADEGTLRFVSVNPYGFGDDFVATLAFEVRRVGFDDLTFEPELAVGVDEDEMSVRFDRVLHQGALADVSDAKILSDEDWSRIVGADSGLQGPALAPGTSNLYGDADPVNGTIDGSDVLYTARVAVGILECIDGTLAGGEDCVAANVRPANTGNSLGVGVESTGGEFNRIIDGNDVLAIARFAVGMSVDVVGTQVGLIDHSSLATRDITVEWCASQGVTCSATGADTVLTGSFTLTNDFVWTLGRAIRVGDDGAQQNVAGANSFGTVTGGTLTVEPGTRVEAASGTSILITRAGQIFAEGTPQRPIHFTCDAATPAPQCWAGLALTGNAQINEDDGTAPNPAPDLSGLPGRSSTGGTGVNQRLFEGVGTAAGQGVYIGGNDDTDNSGTLRYVVISYGGQALTVDNELNNLTMGTLGTGTTIEYVQTHAGLDDGFEWFGGRTQSRFLYATANTDDQMDYSFGFDGDLQYVLIQLAGEGDKGFEVDNTETGTTLNDDTPRRTEASIWNLTVVGGTAAGAPGDKAFNYRRGAASNLNNILVVEAATVFDVDDDASCAMLPSPYGDGHSGTAGTPATGTGQLQFNEFLVLGGTTLAEDGTSRGAACSGDPVTDYVNAQIAANRGEFRAYAGELVDPFDLQLPDFRPVGAGPSTAVTAATPPANGFFDQTATFLGAIRPEGLGGQIPWYAGWTIGWQSSTTR